MDGGYILPQQGKQSVIIIIFGYPINQSWCRLLLCLYLVNIEVTIVSTSLVTIVNDFLAFDKTSWVVTGYLITYTGIQWFFSHSYVHCFTHKMVYLGFIIISDIIGRKTALNATMIIFVVFSAGCGASKSMNELYVLTGHHIDVFI
jgi:MFS family permease